MLSFLNTIFHCSINGGVRENLLAGGRDLWMELDGEGHLRLIDPESGSLHTCQPIHTIRVWGVGRDNGRDFAYVARDKETRKHRQVPNIKRQGQSIRSASNYKARTADATLPMCVFQKLRGSLEPLPFPLSLRSKGTICSRG